MQPSNRRLVTEADLEPFNISDLPDVADRMETHRAYVENLVITDLGTTDGQTKALIESPTSETAQALSATIGSALGDADAALAGAIGNPSSLAGASLLDVVKNQIPAVVLRGPGIDLTGATDSTDALRALYDAGIAAGARKFAGVPGAVYKVNMTVGSQVFNVVTNGVTFDLAESKIDVTAFTSTADTVSPVWLVDGALDFTLVLGEGNGFPVATPTANLGYRGPTLVRPINGAKGIRVDARINHFRYGVQSGAYADATKGGCSDFDLRIRGSWIGYPIALYQADNIKHDIDVESVHRAAYTAGCRNVEGTAAFKNLYIAPYAYLVSDAITSGSDAAANADPVGAPTTSRGASSYRVKVIDKGSTYVAASGSACVGIAMSRLDPVTFSDLHFDVYVKGSDTVSTRMGGFHLISGNPGTYQPRYAASPWSSAITFENVTVSGVVDHSAQTLPSNTSGELYIYAQDDTIPANAPVVRGLNVSGLTILKSSSPTQEGLFIVARNTQGPIRVDGLYAPGITLSLITGVGGAPGILNASTIGYLYSPDTPITLGPGTRVGAKFSDSPVVSTGGQIAGGGGTIRHKETTLTLSAASHTWANAIPGGSIVLGVQGIVTEAITGATGYYVGVPTDTDRFANRNDLTPGLSFGPHSQATDQTVPPFYLTDSGIVVTAKGSAFTGGKVRLILTYVGFDTLTLQAL